MNQLRPMVSEDRPLARVLADIAHALEPEGDAEGRLRRVLSLLRELVPFEQCVLLETSGGATRRLVALPDGVASPALLKRLGALVAGLSERDAGSVGSNAPPSGFHLAVPLVSFDGVLGLLFVARTHAYDEEDLRLLSVVAAQLASYLSAHELRERASRREDALRDADRRLVEVGREKDQLLAMISHECRTPLTAILGWTALLGSGALDPARRAQAVATIERSGKSLVRLVEDLLDLSRVETGTLRVQRLTFDAAAAIEAAVEGARPLCQAKGIELASSLPRGVALVLWDPERLQQVVSNLLGNAVKFTGRRGRIAVALECDDAKVRVRVADTGIGIGEDLLPHVFDRFRQGDTIDPRRQGGLGLGLAIVRTLVELQGGRIRAESPGVGKGATFTLELPRSTEPAGRLPSYAPVPGDAADRRLRGLRVLLVDDSSDVREALSALLEMHGAEVQSAGSVDEALEAVGTTRPDVLLTDISLTGESGFDLLHRLRALDAPGSAPIPAAALTGHTSDEERQRVLEAGFGMHLAKPIEPERLVRAVAKLAKKT